MSISVTSAPAPRLEPAGHVNNCTMSMSHTWSSGAPSATEQEKETKKKMLARDFIDRGMYIPK